MHCTINRLAVAVVCLDFGDCRGQLESNPYRMANGLTILGRASPRKEFCYRLLVNGDDRRPSKEYTLDRINNNDPRGYAPGNFAGQHAATRH